jgi:hypothetical protein
LTVPLAALRGSGRRFHVVRILIQHQIRVAIDVVIENRTFIFFVFIQHCWTSGWLGRTAVGALAARLVFRLLGLDQFKHIQIELGLAEHVVEWRARLGSGALRRSRRPGWGPGRGGSLCR